MDPQATRKDRRDEPHSPTPDGIGDPPPLRARRSLPDPRTGAAPAKQPEDECLYEGDRYRLRHRQGADHAPGQALPFILFSENKQFIRIALLSR